MHQSIGHFASVLCATLLVACGGSSSSSTNNVNLPQKIISGTVAGGAAVVGSVTATDADGWSIMADIQENGKYSLDVTRNKGPFVLRARGAVANHQVEYYSVALNEDVGGVVNITPFTHLIVSNLANGLAGESLVGRDASMKFVANLSANQVTQAERNLRQKLQPVFAQLDVAQNMDLLHSSFDADHRRIDAVMDLIMLEGDAAKKSMIIKNRLTQEVIGEDKFDNPNDNAVPIDRSKISAINRDTAQELLAIDAQMSKMRALLLKGVSSKEDMIQSGVFDTEQFLLSGADFDSYANEIVKQSQPLLAQNTKVKGPWLSDFVIKELSADKAKVQVSLQVSRNDSFGKADLTWTWVKKQGKWVTVGNQEIMPINIEPLAIIQKIDNSESKIKGGMLFSLSAGSYIRGNVHQLATAATISGPGLAQPIELSKEEDSDNWMMLNSGKNYIDECQEGDKSPCVDLSQVSADSVYTVLLRNSKGEILNAPGEMRKLGHAPTNVSQLKPADFAEITSVSIGSEKAIPLARAPSGMSFDYKWDLPTGKTGRYFYAIAQYSDADIFSFPSTKIKTWHSAGELSSLNNSKWGMFGQMAQLHKFGVVLTIVDSKGQLFVTERYMSFSN